MPESMCRRRNLQRKIAISAVVFAGAIKLISLSKNGQRGEVFGMTSRRDKRVDSSIVEARETAPTFAKFSAQATVSDTARENIQFLEKRHFVTYREIRKSRRLFRRRLG
ncbi:MAG: hypothetical protein CMI16_03445 [Opitutaceae bacterium]|nr:hypothetical protein [Opitutaceae bacterium]